MKKIVISTFNNSKNNYGAVFQACALSSFLTQMNYDVSNVTLQKRSDAKKSASARIKAKLKSLLNLPYRKKIRTREKKFRDFTAQTQKQIKFENEAALKANPPQADVYISGSDQVWNPVNIRDDLFLFYAPKGARKISYAASMGNETIPPQNESKFAEYIQQYDVISVREDTMKTIISRYSNKPIVQNIDPVFLLTREQWRTLEKEYSALKYRNYILVYAIEWNDSFNKQLLQLKKRLNLPVVSINIGNFKKICSDQVIHDASPNEFLYLLDHASFVVATSFHGTALSIVFNKPFLSFCGTNKPTRILSLLRHFNLSGYDNIQTVNFNPDYTKANEIILEDRKQALDYLSNAIEQ